MKKIIILLIFLGIGIYFLLFQKEKPPEIIVEEKVITLKKKEEPPPPNFLKEEEKPLQRPYLGQDFKPIDPPTGNINIENKINPDLEMVIRQQLQNPQLPQMTAEIKTQGTFIWVRGNLGRFVEQILVTINTPSESPRSFNAYADAETGEIVHTIEPYQATYSSEEIDSEPQESPLRGETFEESIEQPPEEEMTFPIDEQ